MTSQVHTLIGAYVLNAVDTDERTAVERHLTECDDCAQEATELRATVARLADTTMVPPPPRLKTNVMAAVRRTRQEAPPAVDDAAERILRPRRIGAWRRTIVAVTMSLVVGLVGAGVAFAIMYGQLERERAEADQVAAVLAAEDAEFTRQAAEGGGQVSIVTSRTHDQAVVILTGMPRLSDEETYQLWLVTGESQASAGVLDPGRTSDTRLVSGIATADVIGVTVEPAGGSEAPTTPMVAGLEVPG